MHRGLQWVQWAVLGCGTAYMVKGPTVRSTGRGMMVRRSASRALLLSPRYIQSLSSRAIFGGSLRASRLKVLFWVASEAVPGTALMRGSSLFWCFPAARLRAAWRALLSAGGGAW